MRIANRNLCALWRGAPWLVFALIAPAIIAPTFGGTVRTLDGKIHEGDVRIDQAGKLQIKPAKGLEYSVELNDVFIAQLRDVAPRGKAAKNADWNELPAPWRQIDVGATAGQGYLKVTNGDLYIKSAGSVIGGIKDSLTFIQQSLPADGETSARFLVTGDRKKIQIGLMIRGDGQADCAAAGLLIDAGQLQFVTRAKAGAAMLVKPLEMVSKPVWLRLARRAATVTAYKSVDGVVWTQLASEVIALPAGSQFGVACASAGALAGYHLDDLRAAALAPVNAPSIPTNLPPGLLLRSGTMLAGADIIKADATAVKFSKGSREDQTISNTQIARIIFREIGPDMISKIGGKRVGVLMKNGDFVEGEYKGIGDGRVRFSSVLFGLQWFEVSNQAAAVALGDVETSKSILIVRTIDGSVYMTSTITMKNGKLMVEDALAGVFAIAPGEVTQIQVGPGRMEPLVNLKAAKIEPAGKTISINSTGVAGLAMALGGVAQETGLAIVPGTSASWNIGAQHRALSFKAGVPDGVPPAVSMRFVVWVDGKEVYKSAPRTSVDDATMVLVSVKGAQSITLGVESTAGDQAAAPGLFVQANLMK